MKRTDPKHFFFAAITFFLLHATTQAQRHTTDETTVGFLVESNFSNFNHNGITPSFTVGCATYQLQVGPRITFDQMTGNVIPNSKNSFWDFGFRYGFILRHGFTLFASIRCEYSSMRSSEDWFYQYPNFSPASGYNLGDNSFNARTEMSHYNFNTYLGMGAEFIVVDKLYLTTNVGAGIKTLSGYTRYSNMDTGELVAGSNWLFDNRGLGLMFSAGIGYRL